MNMCIINYVIICVHVSNLQVNSWYVYLHWLWLEYFQRNMAYS